MTMARAQLASAVRRYLMEAADAFKSDGVDDGSEFDAVLDAAAADLSRYKARTLVGSVTLVAEKSDYPAPVDMIYAKQSLWGKQQRRTRARWGKNYPGVLPKLQLISDGLLMITPAPSSAQIASLGSEYKFFYAAFHRIGETAAETTVPESDRHLLILRAVVEALRWLAVNNINKPVRLRDGISQGPRNGTPAALAEQLMKEFERQAK